jgi:hypothetical protein
MLPLLLGKSLLMTVFQLFELLFQLFNCFVAAHMINRSCTQFKID